MGMNGRTVSYQTDKRQQLSSSFLGHTLSTQYVPRHQLRNRQPERAACCIETLVDSFPGLGCVSRPLALLVACDMKPSLSVIRSLTSLSDNGVFAWWITCYLELLLQSASSIMINDCLHIVYARCDHSCD